MTELFEPLPSKTYQVIYADPPWHYRGQVQHGGSSKGFTSDAESYYPTVPIDDLCKLPVSDLRDPRGSALFIWATSPIVAKGDLHKLVDAWGFELKTKAFAWNKMRVNPGSYTLSQTEDCWVAIYKRRPKPCSCKERQYIEELRNKHSQKPHAVRCRIERMYPEASRIELFARVTQETPRKLWGDRWDLWGNESEGERSG